MADEIFRLVGKVELVGACYGSELNVLLVEDRTGHDWMITFRSDDEDVLLNLFDEISFVRHLCSDDKSYVELSVNHCERVIHGGTLKKARAEVTETNPFVWKTT